MNRNADYRYADIIHLPHPVSKRHPRMSMAERAAQFSPFAALSGHDAAIAEAGRLTTERPMVDESMKWEISARLQAAAVQAQQWLHITYFVPDSRKSGGAIIQVRGVLKKIDPYGRRIILQDGTEISIDDVVQVLEINEPELE